MERGSYNEKNGMQMTGNDVEVSSGLRCSTPIYQIVDFFSVAHIVSLSSLYIPLAERLKDPNEGIDAALRLQRYRPGLVEESRT
jgi:hypothetical protein